MHNCDIDETCIFCSLRYDRKQTDNMPMIFYVGFCKVVEDIHQGSYRVARDEARSGLLMADMTQLNYCNLYVTTKNFCVSLIMMSGACN